MLRAIDDVLNRITMYMLMVCGLSLLLVVVFVFSLTGRLDYDPLHIIGSLAIIMTVGFTTNQLMSRLMNVPVNSVSGLITSLILFFLMSPVLTEERVLALAAATFIAISSKFIFAFNGRHVFNPAAFGVFIVAAIGLGSPTWWIGSAVLWPFTLIFGLLIVRKLRRFSMVAVYALVAVVVAYLMAVTKDVAAGESLKLLLASSPLIFLGTVMLTEPSTAPPRRNTQLVYAAVVAALFAAHPKVLGETIYPETALLIGNLFAYAVSSKRRWQLKLVARKQVSDQLWEYTFKPNTQMQFLPGQYMEWTLPIPLLKQDIRGNRRTFTIASSPTEETVGLGIRFYEKPSGFKRGLQNMKIGEALYAGQIAGDFVLPKNQDEKLLLVAGGVGITPFRSMIQYLLDTGQKRDVVLVYMARNQNEFMYKQLLSKARKVGVTTVFMPGTTPVTADQLRKAVPDFANRLAYVSGPPAMVRSIKQQLKTLGLRRSVKTDYFTGY